MAYRPSKLTAATVLFWFSIVLTGCGGEKLMGRDGYYNAPEPAPWPWPAIEQAAENQTSPGLSVVYVSRKIRHINEMPDPKWMVENGVKGEPIRMIAHQFGNGEVFGSGRSREVCVLMQGYLLFENTGTYRIKAKSNDGIRVFLDNKMVLDDPDVHAARFTPVSEIEITRPGHYAIQVRYFQRKGQATLELYWETPGTREFDLIPAMAYSHDGGVS